jgi:hypothetical protein
MVHLLATLDTLRKTLRNPEWVAAIALLIQAGIFVLHALILRKHATTLEKHVEIAGTQATTAKLIGQAIEQQGKVLNEQTKIMDEQLRFQRRIEAKAERVEVFDLLLQTQVSFRMLHQALMEVQLSNYTQEMRSRVKARWEELQQDLSPAAKEVHTSIYLSDEEREYFVRYTEELLAIEETADIRKDIERVDAFYKKHKGFVQKLFALAKTPVETLPPARGDVSC